MVQIVPQRVYQIGAGYEDCNQVDFLRIDPALRLVFGKDHQVGGSQSMLSRLKDVPSSEENYFLSASYDSMPAMRGCGSQKRNFRGFSPGREVLKTIC